MRIGDADSFLPYTRLPEESHQAWHAFVVYRDMGAHRTVIKAARSANKGPTQWHEWSSTHHWVARAAAWDCECDRVRREEILSAQREMVTEHARCAAKLRQRAMEQIDPLDVEKRMALDPDQAVKWLQAAIKIEQISIGLPTERTATTTDADKSADAVYFDALPRHKFLEMAHQAIKTLEKDPAK